MPMVSEVAIEMTRKLATPSNAIRSAATRQDSSGKIAGRFKDAVVVEGVKASRTRHRSSGSTEYSENIVTSARHFLSENGPLHCPHRKRIGCGRGDEKWQEYLAIVSQFKAK